MTFESTHGGPASPGPPLRLAFHPTMGMRASRLVVAGLMVFSGVLFLNLDLPILVVLNFGLAALNVGYFFAFAGFGVVLDPDGITVRGLTVHRLTWQQVRAIQPTKAWGDRRTLIVPVSGPPVKTAAPSDSWVAPDPEFDAKVAAMQRHHMAHAVPSGPPPQLFGQPF